MTRHFSTPRRVTQGVDNLIMLKAPTHSGISISYGDLNQFFSVDDNGRPLTLGEFIKLKESGRGECEERVGRSNDFASSRLLKAANPVFNAEQINDLVNQYLASMADDEALEILGSGSFSKKEIQEQVQQQTSIGVQIIEMILADRNFVEEQILRGNFERP
jgi:hypothetical protein